MVKGTCFGGGISKVTGLSGVEKPPLSQESGAGGSSESDSDCFCTLSIGSPSSLSCWNSPIFSSELSLLITPLRVSSWTSPFADKDTCTSGFKTRCAPAGPFRPSWPLAATRRAVTSSKHRRIGQAKGQLLPVSSGPPPLKRQPSYEWSPQTLPTLCAASWGI